MELMALQKCLLLPILHHKALPNFGPSKMNTEYFEKKAAG
jgi:hypothetical protein